MNRRTTYQKPRDQIEGERAVRGILVALGAVLVLYVLASAVAAVVLVAVNPWD